MAARHATIVDHDPSGSNTTQTTPSTTISSPPALPGNRMPFERGTPWMSSFRGDSYLQEDIYKVSDHVRVGFDDIFSEPFALRTGDIGSALSPHARRVLSHVFGYTQAGLYFFLSLVTGVFLGLAWGVVFGTVNYAVVWILQPALKVLFIVMRIVAMPTKAFVRAFMDPLFQAAGQVFSFISAKLRLKVMGLEYVPPPGAGAGGKDSDSYSPKRAPSKDFSNASSYPQEWLGFV